MATMKVRPQGAPTERLLDVKEAAALLAVKPATLYQWAYQRRIPVVKLFGPRGALRFRQSDIERLIAGSVRPALRMSGERGLDPG
jgi:excisionase family DNA binding protein